MIEMSNIDTAIRKAKETLILSAKENGLYENFGQKEVMELQDRFIDISSYTEKMNKNRKKYNNSTNGQ